MRRLKNEVKSYIEAELRDYHQTKKDLLELKTDMICAVPIRQEVSGGYTGQVGKPTESKAIKLITNRRINHMAKVVQSIETILTGLDETKMTLVRLKYWQRPSKFTDYGIARELNCDESTLWRWKNEIIRAIGIELGMVNEIE